MKARAGRRHTEVFTRRSMDDRWTKLILKDHKGKPVTQTKTLPRPSPRLCASMDICVQLTCGQRQHAGSVQHEENHADVQDGFHFPHTSLYLSWSLVLVLWCRRLLRSWREITHGGKREKTARVQAETLRIFLSFQESRSVRKSATRWKKWPSEEPYGHSSSVNGQKERVYRVPFALFSLLNASCSLIMHYFILFKPLLSLSLFPHSRAVISPSFRPFTAAPLSFFFFQPLFPPPVMGRGVSHFHWITLTLLLSMPQVSALQFFHRRRLLSKRKKKKKKEGKISCLLLLQCLFECDTNHLFSHTKSLLCPIELWGFLFEWSGFIQNLTEFYHEGSTSP